MKRGGYANLAASLRQRLLNLARQSKVEYSIVLIRYAAERWLHNAPFGLRPDAHRGPDLYGNRPHPGKAIGNIGAGRP
jgi:hypothetical protein